MKFFFLTLVMAIALSFLTASFAIAQAPQGIAFEDVVSRIEADAEAFENKTVYEVDFDETVQRDPSLSAAAVARFLEIAEEEARVWGDTILEGDYQADGITRVDTIEAVSLHGKLLAYRLGFSQRAWETGACDIEEDITECNEGRIQQSGFVSTDLQTWVEGENGYAEFN